MNSLPTGYTPRADLLKDRVVLITGAGDGIGKALALGCAKAQATVVLLGRTTAKLEAVYDDIEQLGLPQPAIFPVNLEGACEKDYLDLSQALLDEFGALHGLIHNAADLGEKTPLRNYSADRWQRVFQVNVIAQFLLTKSLLPVLEQADNASVIFTGSSVGYEGRAYWGAYAASKAANENMMQTLAQECEGATNIRVNSINPGGTRTTMRAQAYPAENPETVKSPEALIPWYLYLLGENSVGVTGQQFSYQVQDS